MPTSQYLRRQAALCLRIAAAVDDKSVVTALVVLADEFSVKADELDPSLRLGPEPAGDGSRSGNGSR
jgi:hypothetical protein